jgi:Baseplate J-like protein
MVVANRPGLAALAYRVGTHAAFFETMLARLSTMEVENNGEKLRPLLKFTTRDAADPSIALLDAWATVADVLTYYEERIANEGYLRTAIERRSIIELARLVGYRLRPGVAASVWLALTIEEAQTVVIEPYQVRAQSVPGPGELPQSFENIEKIEARGKWNRLNPRPTRPQSISTFTKALDAGQDGKIYALGLSTGLNTNDPILIQTADTPELYRVVEVNVDAAANRTAITVRPWIELPRPKKVVRATIEAFGDAGAARATLDTLSDELAGEKTGEEIANFVEHETLPRLERVLARRNISAAFKERLKNFSAELKSTVGAIRHDRIHGVGPLASRAMFEARAAGEKFDELGEVIAGGLVKAASVPPANSARLARSPETAFKDHSDLGAQAFGVFRPDLRESLATTLGRVGVTRAEPLKVFALRVKAAPFGHNAPMRSTIAETTSEAGHSVQKKTAVNFSEWTLGDVTGAEESFEEGDDTFSDVIYLDGNYDKVAPESWVVVDTSAFAPKESRLKAPNTPLLIAQASPAQANISRSAYGMSGNSTRVHLTSPSGKRQDAAWLQFPTKTDVEKDVAAEFQLIRRSVVFAQAEELELTDEPIVDPICSAQAKGGWIVLDGVYSELKSGRWVIVSGERTDLKDGFGNTVTGVKSNELAMLAEVVHDVDSGIPGDTTHTRIRFAADLEYCYAQDNVIIYGNVVKATHGETRKETLGSGDGSKSLQQFALKQPPLTYVSAPTPSGIDSTLRLFINDVEWHEAESIFGLPPTARQFVTNRSDAEVTTIVFGNGKQGARLPTGAENVRAQYRQGLGKAGNVEEQKITLLAERPLHVKEVINPRRASGGADPETRDQARKNVPLAVLALDRLVSVSDYSDFARTFGGVGKAFSMQLSDGRNELVHLTIAGAGDAPIEADSDLLRNLRLSLTQFGDPALAVAVAVRELLVLIVSAGVRLLPDYLWEKVAPKIRAKLLDTFSFEARELGQDVFLSEIISAMQSVPGVAYVDVDAFGGIAERNDDGSVRTPNQLIEAAQSIVTKAAPDQRVPVNLPQLRETGTGRIRPAQLAYLVPEVPDTLILNLIDKL